MPGPITAPASAASIPGPDQRTEQLVVSLVTVNTHVRSIYSKLGVTLRAAATRYAIEHRLG